MNSRYFIKSIQLIVICLVTLLASCLVINVEEQGVDNDSSKKVAASFEYQIQIDRQQHLEVENLNGQIVIRGERNNNSERTYYF